MFLQYSDVFVKIKVFQHNLQSLTDYLCFNQTDDLWKWMNDINFKVIFEFFYDINKSHFRFTNSKFKKESMISIKNIMNIHNNVNILKLLASEKSDILFLISDWSFAFYIFIIWNIINVFSEWFSDSHKIQNLMNEDVHKVVYLLKYLIKSSLKFRKDIEKRCNMLTIQF